MTSLAPTAEEVAEQNKLKKLSLEIPTGVEDGMAFHGEGEMSEAGISGDLIVRLHVNHIPSLKGLQTGICFTTLMSSLQTLHLAQNCVPTLEGSEKTKDSKQGTPASAILQIKGKGTSSHW